jgi:hypothetical protein
MSRENIDDRELADPRFMALALRLNCQFVALGSWASARMLAGRLWREDMGLIPLHQWEGAGYPQALLDVGLAWRTDANGNRTDVNDCSALFIYVDGTRERNAWYFEKKENASKAGIASAEARRAKQGSSQPSGGKSPNVDRTDVNGRSTSVEPKATGGNETQPSYSSSVSGSRERQGDIYAGARGPLPVEPPGGVDQDKRNREIAECESAWLGTLAHMGVERNFVRPEEQAVIWQLVLKFGARLTAKALEGARYEPKSKTFDPRAHVDISRAWKRWSAWSDMAANPAMRGEACGEQSAGIAAILEQHAGVG